MLHRNLTSPFAEITVNTAGGIGGTGLMSSAPVMVRSDSREMVDLFVA